MTTLNRPDPWLTWHLGDLVSNGTERGEIFATFSNKAGKTYPKVKILAGPRAGQTAWPWELPVRWTVALDFEPARVKCRCSECDRKFWAPQHQSRCRECVRQAEAEDSVKSSTNTGSRTFSRLGAAPAFQAAPVAANATEEQRERVERGRVNEPDHPF